MANDGLDFTNKNLTGAEMAARGYKFASRYLSANPGGWKELSLAEAKEKTAAGILTIANWETDGKPANTVAKGAEDARKALTEALACGMPAGRPIYFSIDEDRAVDGADHYFEGVNTVIPPEQTGVYGSAGLIQHLHDRGLVKWGWRTMSTGWHGGASTVDSQVEQTGGVTINGISADTDKALATDIGGWFVGGQGGHEMLTPDDVNKVAAAVKAINVAGPGKSPYSFGGAADTVRLRSQVLMNQNNQIIALLKEIAAKLEAPSG